VQPIQPPALLADHDHPRLPGGGDHRQQAPERPVTEDHHRLPGFDARPLDATQRARQRLGERRARGRRTVEAHQVDLDQARRERDELAVGAVDEQQVLAEVRPAGPAERAGPARRGVGADRAVALAHAAHAGPHRGHRSRELVPEHGGHVRDHHRMTAAQRLHVGAARERGLDPKHHLAGPRLGNRHALVAQIARTVKDQRAHRAHGVT
jgi:hypothetical protein